MHVSHMNPFVPDQTMALHRQKAAAEAASSKTQDRIYALLGEDRSGGRGSRQPAPRRDDATMKSFGGIVDAAKNLSSQLIALERSSQGGSAQAPEDSAKSPGTPATVDRGQTLDDLLAQVIGSKAA